MRYAPLTVDGNPACMLILDARPSFRTLGRGDCSLAADTQKPEILQVSEKSIDEEKHQALGAGSASCLAVC